jgi:hypothetical protein
VGNWGAPPNPEREKQFLAGSGGKVDLGARTQTETEQRARPNNNEQREAGPRKSRAGSDRRCREIQSGKKQDRRTTACGKKRFGKKRQAMAQIRRPGRTRIEEQAGPGTAARLALWSGKRRKKNTSTNRPRTTKTKTRQSSMNKKRSTEIRDRAAKSDLAPPNQTRKNTQHTQVVNQIFFIKI